jgi:outer membrane receptor protein involved in Fe transport
MGYNTKLSKKKMTGNTSLTSTAGAGFRYDHINPSELDHTMNANVLESLQLGHTREASVFGYFDETIGTGKWLFDGGIRADYFHFYYMNTAPAADTFASKIYDGLSPDAHKTAISPKLNIQYTFNPKAQVYLKTGKGFHSNDARVVIANQGFDILPAAYGIDLGVNWKPIPQLFINTALWYLYLKQEFTFGQDLIDQPGGPVQPGGKTSRMGIDLSARYQFTDWLFASMNANLARPRFIDSAAGHNHVPLAPTFTSTAGLDFRLRNGINGGISYRYMHNRPANETYTLIAVGYWVTDMTLNYTKKNYSIGLAVENLLNVTWNESQFEYTSRLKYEARPVDEVSYTPGVPFFAKLKFAVFF